MSWPGAEGYPVRVKTLTGCSPPQGLLRSLPGSPSAQPGTAEQSRGKRGLSERTEFASSAAPVLIEARRVSRIRLSSGQLQRANGVKRRASRWGAVSFACVSLGTQRLRLLAALNSRRLARRASALARVKVGWVRATTRIEKQLAEQSSQRMARRVSASESTDISNSGFSRGWQTVRHPGEGRDPGKRSSIQGRVLDPGSPLRSVRDDGSLLPSACSPDGVQRNPGKNGHAISRIPLCCIRATTWWVSPPVQPSLHLQHANKA